MDEHSPAIVIQLEWPSGRIEEDSLADNVVVRASGPQALLRKDFLETRDKSLVHGTRSKLDQQLLTAVSWSYSIGMHATAFMHNDRGERCGGANLKTSAAKSLGDNPKTWAE